MKTFKIWQKHKVLQLLHKILKIARIDTRAEGALCFGLQRVIKVVLQELGFRVTETQIKTLSLPLQPSDVRKLPFPLKYLFLIYNMEILIISFH